MASTYNITINQHADFRRSFQIKKDNVILDITGYNFTARLKESFNATTHVAFTTAIENAAAGTFSIALTDAVTATMVANTWVYDIVMADASGVKTRLIQGNAFLKQGVTP